MVEPLTLAVGGLLAAGGYLLGRRTGTDVCLHLLTRLQRPRQRGAVHRRDRTTALLEDRCQGGLRVGAVPLQVL